MKKHNKRFIGVAWPYINGEKHIGHVVGYLLPCDIFARFSRLQGIETVMVSGGDSHGTPITVEADKKGVSPQEIINEYEPKFEKLYKTYSVTYDLFTSTRTENHKKVTQDMFIQLLENGYITKQKSEQYYSKEDDKFLPDRYVEGECPYCGTKDQRADQCENCGRTIGMGELIDAHSKLTGNPVSLKETEHYFLELGKLQEQILASIDAQSETKKWVVAEAKGWIKEGLHARAITRDLDWGIEIPVDRIPEDQQIENIKSKRFYVWFEAVIGYISATVEYFDMDNSEKRSVKAKEVDDFWKNPECHHSYFMGQDNLAFHMLFWPGQLIGAKQGYNLPDNVSIVKFLNLEGAKLSTSRGHIIDAQTVADEYGADYIRFYLSLILPENKQTDWYGDDFRNRINGDLVGTIGNFIHRTLVFYKSRLKDTVGEQTFVRLRVGEETKQESQSVFAEVTEDLEANRFVSAINRILKHATFGNQYFDHQKPWERIKTDPEAAVGIVLDCIQIVKNLSVLLNPFVPELSGKIAGQLGIQAPKSEPETYEVGKNSFEFEEIKLEDLNIPEKLEPLFRKIEEESK